MRFGTCLLFVFLAVPAFASERSRGLKKLVEEIHNEFTKVSESFSEPDSDMVFSSNNTNRFYLGLIRNRYRPNAGFKLPGVVRLKVSPWVEFYWTRKPPEGWQNYKPKASPQ